jgi:hypothetical protein
VYFRIIEMIDEMRKSRRKLIIHFPSSAETIVEKEGSSPVGWARLHPRGEIAWGGS